MIKHLMIVLSLTVLTGLSDVQMVMPATAANQTNLLTKKLLLAQSSSNQTPKTSLIPHAKAKLGGISLSMTEALLLLIGSTMHQKLLEYPSV